MDTQLQKHIETAGYVDAVTGRVKRKAMAQSIADLLNETDRVVHSKDPAEIATKALSLDEISYKIFRANAPELRAYVGMLTGARGLVQYTMEDGTVLCSAKVEKPVGDIEGTTRKIACRFVSDNPDTTWEHVILAARVRHQSTVNGAKALLAVSSRRQPALAGRRNELAAMLHEDVNALSEGSLEE